MNDIRDIMHDGVKPDRAADNLRVHNCNGGGFTEFKRKRVVSVSAPLRGGAQARTIRIHELLHANHSTQPRGRKYPPIAQNAIEDARVHSIYWPDGMPRRANRDCLATALSELRGLPPMAALARADDWNIALLSALRCWSIVSRLGNGGHRDRAQARVNAAFGPAIAEKLCDILPLVRSRKGKALAAFTALMRTDDETGKGKGSTGSQTDNPMRIIKLPMPDVCNSAVRRTALTRSGARLNRARLARAVATGSTVGLFIRPRYLAGGTYLFDASGSMHLSESRLNALCQSVPAARVAYYSGAGMEDATGCYGELCVYADNGRRADACTNIYGGNSVDLFAIQWLLKQPAPRVFVSDGGFCGGPEGQDAKAAVLLAAAVAGGKVTWHRSISELEESLAHK